MNKSSPRIEIKFTEDDLKYETKPLLNPKKQAKTKKHTHKRTDPKQTMLVRAFYKLQYVTTDLVEFIVDIAKFRSTDVV